MHRILSLFLAFTLTFTACAAGKVSQQPLSSLDRSALIHPKGHYTIVTKSGQTLSNIKGRNLSVDPNSGAFLVKDTKQSVAWEDVQSVTVKTRVGSNAGKGAAIGAAVGGALGLATGISIGTQEDDCSSPVSCDDPLDGLAAAIGTFVGFGLFGTFTLGGLAIGAATPKYETTTYSP